MAARRSEPPMDYLHTASTSSLESYELSRLNHAANLRREITALLDQWIEETVHAQLARWVLEDRALERNAPVCEPQLPQRQLPFEAPVTPKIARLRVARPLKLPRRSTRNPLASEA